MARNQKQEQGQDQLEARIIHEKDGIKYIKASSLVDALHFMYQRDNIPIYKGQIPGNTPINKGQQPVNPPIYKGQRPGNIYIFKEESR